MLHYLSLTLFVLLVGTFSIVVDRYRQKSRLALGVNPNADGTNSSSAAANVASRSPQLADLAHGVQQWVARRFNQGFPDHFRKWSQKSLTDPALKEWLASLPDPAFARLTQHISEFCRQMGIDLHEVVYGHFDTNPMVQMAVVQTIENYCRACTQAVSKHAEIAAWRAVCAYERQPNSRANQTFAQTLFTRLLEARLFDGDLAEYKAATDTQRHALLAQAIQTAARRDNGFFNDVLKSVTEEK